MNDQKFSELYLLLGHEFAHPALLEEALSHPSLDRRRHGGRDYQRLEFLGDRVLGLVISTALYRDDSGADEGSLAVRFNTLVRRETVADAARLLGLGAYILLGRSEEQQGGRDKSAILADVCEAVLGALYLDGGLAVAEAFVLRYWAEFMANSSSAAKDPKTELQELIQRRDGKPPRYQVLARNGPDHAPCFTVEVRADGIEPASGQGGSLQEAEKEAAKAMLASVDTHVHKASKG
ncbi:MAG: ribonuclease III [Proteobacteria bacterium]|nr:ribonuclease III [Pseudomonadota bacterium]